MPRHSQPDPCSRVGGQFPHQDAPVADVAVDPQEGCLNGKLFRKGKEVTLKVTVGRLEDGEKTIDAAGEPEEPADAPDEGKPVLGMMLEELSVALRETETISADVKGVFIGEVEVGSNAADKGIKAGEIIVEVNQEAVGTPEDVVGRVDELKKNGRKNALLMISSKEGDIRFVVVRIDN